MAADKRVGVGEGIDIRGEAVEVLVGEEGQRFIIHQSLLCSSSEFFQAATKKEWGVIRGSRNPIDLSDENPKTFHIYTSWLYSKTLPTKTSNSKTRSCVDFQREFSILAKAYVLGEKLIDPTSQNDVLQGIIANASTPDKAGACQFPDGDAINIIYQGTTEASPARQLLVDFWVWIAHEGWNQYTDITLPKEFLLVCAETHANS